MTYYGSIPKLMLNGVPLAFQEATYAFMSCPRSNPEMPDFLGSAKVAKRLNPIMDSGKSTEETNNVLRLCNMSH